MVNDTGGMRGAPGKVLGGGIEVAGSVVDDAHGAAVAAIVGAGVDVKSVGAVEEEGF